ncbi:Hypothetical predicted protein [Mytilus galloprovincialis]|uniref:Death domain-containing protein n=1 Tax=Mytilus galloprovincialis TaxID=29158 RepID=A0A8B6C9S1_MYTGA|nr:Hypothetical predicted protein [Mytilus galloprovincialis]
MDELNDINKQNDKIALTSAQLKSFLKVNHALGKLIYFDEAGLRDNVIIDPVFLVDVLRSIVTDDQFWPEHLKEILKSLKESGKLLKRDLYEIWKQDCFHQKDDEDGSDFFLVPCMISNKREESQQIDHDRSIHLAYRFKEEVVPPAILYRFIATFISIWKLRVSAKSSRLMIFTDSADIGIPCGTDLCFFDHTLSAKEWICPEHKTKHKTNDVSIWFADKLHTKDDRCTENCPGLDKVWLDRQPEDKHLGRLAAKLTNEDTRKIYIRLQEVDPALQWNIINESSKRGGFDIKINALYDWKKSSVFASFKQLQQSLNDEDIDIHKLCQISREVKKEFNQPREKLQLRPSISNTQKLPDHIGNQTFQLGIELGLSVVEMQQIESNHVTNLRSQTEEVLNKWRRLPEATYEVLEKALHLEETIGMTPMKLEELLNTALRM